MIRVRFDNALRIGVDVAEQDFVVAAAFRDHY
jgi:hypothetical protein